MTRIRNATNRPLVRFRTGRVTNIRVRPVPSPSQFPSKFDGQLQSMRAEGAVDSCTGGEMGIPGCIVPEVYPEDGLEVILVGQVPGTAMPLQPEEARKAFKVERPANPPWRAWGILDEWDTLYEIREKV